MSASNISLSIGQNAGCINNIENVNALPSMSGFLFICVYLGITPSEFFDTDTKHPEKLRDLIASLKKLNDTQLWHITEIINDMIN